jgi:phosphoribosyl 1,2-cyclic phosphate phosphodiesterase
MHLVENKAFRIDDLEIIPIRAFHNKLPIFGYRIGNFAYLTDVKTLPDNEKTKLRNLKVLVLNCLRKEPHVSHLNLEEALEIIKEVRPERAYLTHLSHRFGTHSEIEKTLPEKVFAACDGLVIDCD